MPREIAVNYTTKAPKHIKCICNGQMDERDFPACFQKMPYPLPLFAWRHLWMLPYLCHISRTMHWLNGCVGFMGRYCWTLYLSSKLMWIELSNREWPFLPLICSAWLPMITLIVRYTNIIVYAHQVPNSIYIANIKIVDYFSDNREHFVYDASQISGF